MIQKPMVFEDLGIELPKDSEDFSEEEAASAIDTDNADDFIVKLVNFLKDIDLPEEPLHERRIRAGINYSRTTMGPHKIVFKIGWHHE
jgi:hypothetical protein